jgi:hypothetical protein
VWKETENVYNELFFYALITSYVYRHHRWVYKANKFYIQLITWLLILTQFPTIHWIHSISLHTIIIIDTSNITINATIDGRYTVP